MPPASPQQGQPTDNHMAPLWIVIGVFILFIVIWMFLRGPLITAFFRLKLLEIDFINLFMSTPSLQAARQIILRTPVLAVNFNQLIFVANTVGDYVAVPAGILLAICAFLLYRRGIGSHFRRSYTMKTLLNYENQNWPQTSPILTLDLVNIDIEQGTWAMAMTPMQFAKKNGLLRVQKQVQEEGMLSRDLRMEAHLLKSKAHQCLVRQVGPLFQGIESLTIYNKALFAAFAARVNGDVEGARVLLYRISASAKTNRLDFTGVKELLAKHQNNDEVKSAMEQHAFVLTVMASMLMLARSVGVQASADFLWLKAVDRRMWFMLNAVGRQTPTVEVAGPFAHWLVERRLGRKIVTPMVEEAVKGLDLAIQEMIYKSDE